MKTDEPQGKYELAYVSPAIEKMVTNFVLPPLKTDARWRDMTDKYGVYFVQGGEGYIKIGKSSHVLKRVGSYRTHNPMMRLVGIISPAPACVDYNENLLHRLWEPFIVSLEWFAPVRPLIEYIQSFDKDGFGHPLELMNTEPGTWQELLNYQKKIEGLR